MGEFLDWLMNRPTKAELEEADRRFQRALAEHANAASERKRSAEESRRSNAALEVAAETLAAAARGHKNGSA